MAKRMLVVAFTVFLCAGGVAAAAEAPGYWSLLGDATGGAARAVESINHGVVFDAPSPDGSPATRFDGRGAWIEVPPGALPALGTRDFTIALEVCTAAELDDGLGDLVCQFDTAARRGFNLTMPTFSGVSNSQSNYRNVFFGIDNGHTEEAWTDCGRPGNAIFIFGLTVHDDVLYAATCEAGANERGHVYRYAGGAQWADCGGPGPSNAIGSLAAFDGALYAGTSWYDTTGSALSASENTAPGGDVYRYDGGTNWTYCGTLENPETGRAITISGLTVFRGRLYATTLKQGGMGLYRYEGGTQWTYCGNPGRRVLNPCAFNGALYMVSYDQPGGPFRYDGAQWEYVGGTIAPPIDQDYSFAVYGGRLHVSTWPKAYVYRMDEAGAWSPRGAPAGENETMGILPYNGKLYVGTLPSSCVYRLDGEDTWTPVGQQLDTAEGKYRRAWSMAVYRGRLFCGTLPSGRVFSLASGAAAGLDRDLGPGWRHIAAVRDGDRLRLYVDGKPCAESASFNPADYDLTVDTPLCVGFGPCDYFNAWMRDARLYDRALSGEEIGALSEKP